MSTEIAIVFGILAVSLILFVSEVIRMDLVAFLVLAFLSGTGLVSSETAFSGFSNGAVVTIWSMYILSEGLARTGIADVIGRQVLRLAGAREGPIVAVVMMTAAGLAAFMNNIGVAALMLPVAVDIAGRTRISPSRLLMPLSYATLLGGTMTLMGTTNLLISESLKDAGFEGFSLFDYTPLGGGIVIVGILFVVLFGRFFLPTKKSDRGRSISQRGLRMRYGLHKWTFLLRVPFRSMFVGKSLAESRLGSATGLIILALLRGGRSEPLPSRQTVLRGGDGLLVQGRIDQIRELHRWGDLVIERESPVLKSMVTSRLSYAEVDIADGSSLVSQLIRHAAFRTRFNIAVVGVSRAGGYRLTNLANVPIKAGDRLLVQGETDVVEQLGSHAEFAKVEILSPEDLARIYRADERMFVVRIPRDSELAGTTLAKSQLVDVFDFRVSAVFRNSQLTVMPRADVVLEGGDLLLVEGQPADLDVLRSFQELEIETKLPRNVRALESQRLSMVEATLDPRSRLAGKTVAELNFRERYGIEIAAIRREGDPISTNLTEMRLQVGDFLLLLGPHARLELLATDPDFLLISPLGREPPDTRRAPLAALIMAGVVASVMTGIAPISIAAVIGASFMVLLGCLTMEQAHRAIDWRAIFLIAGMLPLGTAMQETGADVYITGQLMNLLGDAGPWQVIMGLYVATAMATMIMPTAALVVLMAPIVLSTMNEMGLAPETAMMAVAVAASASFASPISHPANILVMGPGGYRFVDYMKLGVPLTIVVFFTCMFLLPRIWPLIPIG